MIPGVNIMHGFGDQKCYPSFNINQDQGTVSAASSVSVTEESLITHNQNTAFWAKKHLKKHFGGHFPSFPYFSPAFGGEFPTGNCETALEVCQLHPTEKFEPQNGCIADVFLLEPPPLLKKKRGGGKSSNWINLTIKVGTNTIQQTI